MAQSSWGQGHPADSDSGLLDVLSALASQGGTLFGARRLPDSPLTLTDLRWQGAGGATMDTRRRNPTGNDEPNAEREVWVQLALHCPLSMAPTSQDTLWAPIAVTREEVMSWVSAVRREQANRRMSSAPGYGPSGGSLPYPDGYLPDRRDGSRMPPSSVPGYTMTPAPPSAPLSSVGYRAQTPPHTTVTVHPSSDAPGRTPYSFSAPGGHASQATGSWQRSTMGSAEVVVLPCIEVELPPQGDPTTAEYRRDFSRDVAMHFGRAVRAIPQVREARGWMRGDLLVLAARFVVGTGQRPASRPEMEATAHYLAQVLAQRTLPYIRLSFADPGEWMQGAALPE